MDLWKLMSASVYGLLLQAILYPAPLRLGAGDNDIMRTGTCLIAFKDRAMPLTSEHQPVPLPSWSTSTAVAAFGSVVILHSSGDTSSFLAGAAIWKKGKIH